MVDKEAQIVESLVSVAERLGSRALRLGASAAGLAALAYIPGYLYYGAYLWAMGPLWALSQVGVASIVGAGALVVCFLGFNILVILIARLVFKHSETWWSIVSILSVPISFLVIAGSQWHIGWLSGPWLKSAFTMSILLGTAVVFARVAYTTAVSTALTPQQRAAASLGLPFMSALFAVLVGMHLGARDLVDQRRFERVELTAAAGGRADWRLALPLADHLLVTSRDAAGHRIFRVVAMADVVSVADPEGSAPIPSNRETPSSEPVAVPRSGPPE